MINDGTLRTAHLVGLFGSLHIHILEKNKKRVKELRKQIKKETDELRDYYNSTIDPRIRNIYNSQ